ncbi:MAG: amylo-alpha-1,6-glucosidase [Thermoplasmata archaeon]
MTDDVEPPLLELERSDPRQPILVTGLAAAAVLSGSSEVALSRETRGAELEWGGVYAQGIRLTGPWTVRLAAGGRASTLPETLHHLAAYRWGVGSEHATGSIGWRQEIVPFEHAPGVVRRLIFAPAARFSITLTTRFEPFLAPVLMEGIKPYAYHLEGTGTSIEFRSHGFGATLDADPPAQRMAVDGRPWDGDPLQGEVREVRTEHDLTVDERGAVITWVMRGGLERSFRDVAAATVLGAREDLTSRARVWQEWRAGTPEMRLPDDPVLESGYRLARSALRSLYTSPDAELTGLVAGYPWYSAVWCRDLAWMLPAVAWLGDHAWAERAIRSVFRFQARAAIPILAAEAGELPMQISPGPIFLYGTSDTTLYYPALLRQVADHAGRTDLLRDLAPELERIAAWAHARTLAPSGLFRNGGEIAEVRAATSGLSRIDYGFEAVDTTIWDSTDRRDHAIDLQVLYRSALGALADLASRRGEEATAQRYRAEGEALAHAVAERYWWPEEGYLYDSLTSDGTPVAKVRPNALRAVAAGLLAPERARTVLDRALQDDLATPWGLRTLSRRDPGYRPTAYHDGEVWPIATAWAAEAAYALGDAVRGGEILRGCAERIVAEHGLANECYRGDRPEAYDSCFLLGFSVAPFLTTLFEGLWGLRIGPQAKEIAIDPHFPPSWTRASVRGLRVGPGVVDVELVDDHLSVRWSGPSTLGVRSGAASMVLGPSDRCAIAGPFPSKGF